MKLIYSTPNLIHFVGHISNVLQQHYEMTSVHATNVKSDDHTSLLIEVPKGSDKYLCDDMFQALALTPSLGYSTTIEMRETMYSYFINMSVTDYKRLMRYPLENVFIRKLINLVDKNIIKLSERITYPIPYHPRFNFQVLDDMRHLSHDYMKILSTTGLNREELRQLFRITIWLKLSASVSRDLKDDMYLINSNRYCAYNDKIDFDPVEKNDKSMTLNLVDLTNEVELNPAAVKIGITARRITSFIKKFFIYHQDTTIAYSVLPMSVYTDTFVTLSLDQLSQFLDGMNTELESKSYYKYLNGVAETLTRTDNLMEFILNGKGRH